MKLIGWQERGGWGRGRKDVRIGPHVFYLESVSSNVLKIRVGPAGWSYEDWKGYVYPTSAGRGFDPLAYLVQYFDTIEVNSTFYHPPVPRTTNSWVRRTAANPRFKFTVKLFRKFTHERGQATDEDEVAYKTGMGPLVDAGKLGAILVQFPWSFKNTVASRSYLRELLDRFNTFPLVIEVRHASWNQDEVYRFLADRGVGFCNIDQPIFRRSLAPSSRITSRVGYVRLHGRNYENWFSATADTASRYDYLYSPVELKPWIENILAVSEHAKEVYVITNNHFHGKEVVNALEILSEITGKKVPVPEPVLNSYPRLNAIAESTS